MGIVYLARQISLNRIVAVKTIRSGLFANDEEIRRFLTEAEAAAGLDHPNIVPVYEVAEENGLHFFSMGYVDGKSLREQLLQGPLNSREAASLLRTIAEAVAFAHRNGIVHRDLKPGNILLPYRIEELQKQFGSNDTHRHEVDFSLAKIADFGLAKRTTDDNSYTMTGQVLGTPSYLSPEQASGNLEEVGPSSDIHSLGAILYCVLTGHPPFEAASAVEILRLVQEQEPIPIRQSNPSVEKDIETICLKCLEKEKSRRYRSASELVDELERFLSGKQIVARPLGPLTRLWRRSKQRPGLALLTVSLISAIVLGTAVSWNYAIQANASARLSRDEKKRADKEAENAREALSKEKITSKRLQRSLNETEQLIHRWVETTRNEKLLTEPRFRPVLKTMLKNARDHYERFIEENADLHDVPTRVRLANALFLVGQINFESGSESEAIEAYRRAISFYEKLAKEFPENVEYRHGLAESNLNLGVLFSKTGKPNEARTSYEAALDLWKNLSRQNPVVADYRIGISKCYHDLGLLHSENGDSDRAILAMEEAIQLLEPLVAEYASNNDYAFELARSHNSLAKLYRDIGRTKESMANLIRFRDILERLRKNHPANLVYVHFLARSYGNLGSLFAETKKPDEAIVAFENALPILNRLTRDNPTVHQYATDLAAGHFNLGMIFTSVENLDKARKHFQEALAIQQRLVSENPLVAKNRSDLAKTYNFFGIIETQTGRLSEAVVAYEKAIEIRKQLFQDHSKISQNAIFLAGSYVNLANLHRNEDPNRAVEHLGNAIKLLEPVLKREPRHPVARRFLRNAYWTRAQTHESLEQYSNAVTDWEGALRYDDGSGKSVLQKNRDAAVAKLKLKKN